MITRLRIVLLAITFLFSASVFQSVRAEEYVFPYKNEAYCAGALIGASQLYQEVDRARSISYSAAAAEFKEFLNKKADGANFENFASHMFVEVIHAIRKIKGEDRKEKLKTNEGFENHMKMVTAELGACNELYLVLFK